jgi:hypothetical protein
MGDTTVGGNIMISISNSAKSDDSYIEVSVQDTIEGQVAVNGTISIKYDNKLPDGKNLKKDHIFKILKELQEYFFPSPKPLAYIHCPAPISPDVAFGTWNILLEDKCTFVQRPNVKVRDIHDDNNSTQKALKDDEKKYNDELYLRRAMQISILNALRRIDDEDSAQTSFKEVGFYKVDEIVIVGAHGKYQHLVNGLYKRENSQFSEDGKPVFRKENSHGKKRESVFELYDVGDGQLQWQIKHYNHKGTNYLLIPRSELSFCFKSFFNCRYTNLLGLSPGGCLC